VAASALALFAAASTASLTAIALYSRPFLIIFQLLCHRRLAWQKITSSDFVSCSLRCVSFSFRLISGGFVSCSLRCVSFSFGLINYSDFVRLAFRPSYLFVDRTAAPSSAIVAVVTVSEWKGLSQPLCEEPDGIGCATAESTPMLSNVSIATNNIFSVIVYSCKINHGTNLSEVYLDDLWSSSSIGESG
jgi:hypothetical protein